MKAAARCPEISEFPPNATGTAPKAIPMAHAPRMTRRLYSFHFAGFAPKIAITVSTMNTKKIIGLPGVVLFIGSPFRQRPILRMTSYSHSLIAAGNVGITTRPEHGSDFEALRGENDEKADSCRIGLCGNRIDIAQHEPGRHEQERDHRIHADASAMVHAVVLHRRPRASAAARRLKSGRCVDRSCQDPRRETCPRAYPPAGRTGHRHRGNLVSG